MKATRGAKMKFKTGQRVLTPEGAGTIVGCGSVRGEEMYRVRLDQPWEAKMFAGKYLALEDPTEEFTR
jgi:hypothetical protein